MPSSTPSPESSLDRHLQALYPLARVLAGSEKAAILIEDVYSQVADVPPDERPDDERAWLFRLLIEHRDGSLPSTGADVHPGTETSFTDDPFRREVAEQTAERKLPVAFAACSLHERVILAVDVLASPSDELLASALDTTVENARSIRDQARSALRASLRDVLNGPERMLVDVALPDEALRAQLRTLFKDHFQPAPSSLRATVRDILERAQAKRKNDASDSSASGLSLLSSLGNKLSVRHLVGTLVLIGVLGLGITGWEYFTSSPSTAPPSPQSMVALAAQQASEITVAHPTTDAESAAAYVRETWDRRVAVPSIEGATLQGVGRLQAGSDAAIPVFLFDDPPEKARIVVYAFNYALLNRLGPHGTLDRSLRSQLTANRSLLEEEHADRNVVLWRQQDDILVAVAPHLSSSTLRTRIQR